MKVRSVTVTAVAVAVFATSAAAQTKHANAVIDLWAAGKPAFGVYAPNERPRDPNAPPPGPGAGRGPTQPPIYTKEGGEKLAMNPLYDYVFLNLEGAYDPAAVRAISEGLRSPKAVSRKTLIVRIPPIDKDGPGAAKARVKEIFEAGADGVTIPHILSLEEAKLALTFFEAAKVDVWSPANPTGEKLAMLMLEDPKAVEQARDVAGLKGLSILACGIGSLTQALGGDRAAAEAGTQKVLAETTRAKIANMLTANAQDIERRITEGFNALLMQGPSADETIKLGRAAVGR